MRVLIPIVLTLTACGTDPSILIVSFPTDTADTEGPYRVEVIPTPQDPFELDLELSFPPAENVSAVPFERVEGEEQWVARIAGRPAGSEVQFRVKLIESGVTIVRAPEGGPLSFRILAQE